MAKKTECVPTHMTLEEREQIKRIATMEGFGSVSEYLRHLATCAIDEKRRQFETLRGVFGDDDETGRSVSSRPLFMRELAQDLAAHH